MSEAKERYYEEYEDLDDCLYNIGIHYWAHEYIKELEKSQKQLFKQSSMCFYYLYDFHKRFKKLEEYLDKKLKKSK